MELCAVILHVLGNGKVQFSELSSCKHASDVVNVITYAESLRYVSVLVIFSSVLVKGNKSETRSSLPTKKKYSY